MNEFDGHPGTAKSDDENAIEKLQDKVDGLREDQERMKQANKAIRMKDKEKGDATLHDMGYTDEQIAQLREPDFCGRSNYREEGSEQRGGAPSGYSVKR